MTKIFLIAVDALRKDVAYGGEVATPNIDRLASNGQRVEKAFANGPNTSAAFPAILCSSAVNDLGSCPDTTTVAEALQREGFETIAISTNPHTSPYFGYGRGVDHFTDFVKAGAEKEERSLLFRLARTVAHSSDWLYELIRKHRAKIDLPYERADRLNEEAFDRLEEGEDQFVFLHYMDPHYPYLPPGDYADTGSAAWQDRFEINRQIKEADAPREELTEKMWELYTGEVRYFDAALGDLLDRLEELDEDVIIVFTADHGEQFGEFGSYLHPDELYNVQLNVPFIVSGVDINGDLVSHLDIAPTLLGAVGGDEAAFEGIDLTSEERHAVTVTLGAQRCVITPDWKLMDDGTEQRLFAADAYLETDDLAQQQTEVVEELAPMLEEQPAVQGIDV